MWHFEQSGKAAGPFTEEETRDAINAGRLTPRTLVWREGMIEWQPAARTELAAQFPGGAQPPPLAGASAAFDSQYPGDYRYAGFWIRVAAYIIDVIIVEVLAGVGGGVIGIVIGIVAVASGSKADHGLLQAAGGFIGLLSGLLYYALIPSTGWQATPGKRLLGLHIIRTDGRKLGFGLALGRYLAYIPSSLILGIGFFMIGWTDQKQGLHDMMCRTRVVYGRPRVADLASVFE